MFQCSGLNQEPTMTSAYEHLIFVFKFNLWLFLHKCHTYKKNNYYSFHKTLFRWINLLHILPVLQLFVHFDLKPSPAVNQWSFGKAIINSTPLGKHPISVWLWGSSTPVCSGFSFFLNPFSLFCLHHHIGRQGSFHHKLKNTHAGTHT